MRRSWRLVEAWCKRDAFPAIAVVALFLVVFLFAGKSCYEVSDDIAMLAVLKGLFGLRAGFETIFISLPLSWVLYSLYQGVPSFPWYAGTLFLTGLLSLGVAAFTLLRVVREHWCRWVLVVLLLVFYWKMVNAISFTAVALVAAITAMAAIAVMLREEVFPWGLRLLVVVLLVVGYAIRPSIFPLGVLLFLPGILLFFGRWRRHLRKLLWLALPVVVFCLVDIVGVQLLRNRGDFGWWLSDYNRKRAQFNDYARPVTSEALSAAGWSSVDYVIFKNWWLHDQDLFNEAALTRFSDSVANSQEVNLEKQVGNYFRQLQTVASTNRQSLLMLLLAACGMLLLLPARALAAGEGSRAVAAIALLSHVAIVLLQMGVRFPQRIALPVFVSLVVALPFYLAQWGAPGGVPIGVRRLVGLVLIVTLGVVVYGDMRRYEAVAAHHEERRHAEQSKSSAGFMQIAAQGEDTVFVDLNPVVYSNVTSFKPFDENREVFALNLMPGGSSAGTMGYANFLRDHFGNCGSNPVVCMLGNENVVYFFYDSSHFRYDVHINYFLKHLHAHYRDNFPGKRFVVEPIIDQRTHEGLAPRGLVFFKIRLSPTG